MILMNFTNSFTELIHKRAKYFCSSSTFQSVSAIFSRDISGLLDRCLDPPILLA